MHAQLGQIMDNKIQRDTKPSCCIWRAGSKSRVLCMPLYSTPPKEWAKHLSHPSSLTPGRTPTLTPYREPVCPSLESEQGNLLLVLAPHWCSRGPNKALPEFLVWPLINFYWLGKAKNPGRYHFQRRMTGDGEPDFQPFLIEILNVVCFG